MNSLRLMERKCANAATLIQKLSSLHFTKELYLCHRFKFINPYILATWWCKPLIFQTYIIWSSRIHSLKYLRSTALGWKHISIRKPEFVAKTQILYMINNNINQKHADTKKNSFTVAKKVENVRNGLFAQLYIKGKTDLETYELIVFLLVKCLILILSSNIFAAAIIKLI